MANPKYLLNRTGAEVDNILSNAESHVVDNSMHMTEEEKRKLAGIAEGANNYTHPNTHAATMITEDSAHRFVTDVEKTTWNNKANTDLTNIDNSTFKAKVEASGFTSGTQVQICKWEAID